jgi:peptidoglycan hydrolase CwlO-like protein
MKKTPFAALLLGFLLCSCSHSITANRAPQNTPDPNFSLGDGYDISALPDDFRELKKELSELQEQNKKLAVRIEALEKNVGGKP